MTKGRGETERLGREVFGPLGGIVEIGSVVDAGGGRPLSTISVSDFTARHRDELNRILAAVRDIGGFPPETMRIVDDLGWHRDHAITAASLLLWSSGVEAYSPLLEQPESVRRMLRAGADIQLVNLMHALVGAAAQRIPHRDPEDLVLLIVAVIDIAAALVGLGHPTAVRDVFRMWRVAYLPGVLMPSSTTPAAIKQRFRTFAHILDARD
ncbi:hypothetical protein ACF1G0_13575 [Streptomyces sp. NPDC013953]|uniref:hypothetical protein n=1 Tax=Streptomyces sp. NPDC013953 TaxID=3364868 RepID=UPI0036FBD07D